jgi:enoyl-CoA hydratase/carnithine racemase
MIFQHLIYKVEDGVAHVILNRPEKYNAFNYQLMQDIVRVQKVIKKNRDIRVVIISGNGDNFSSGIDTTDIMGRPIQFFKIGWKPWLRGTNMAQRFCIGWHRLPVPVICVIHGICYGMATTLALGADMRYAKPGAQLAIMEAKWGMMPDMAGLQTVRNTIRQDIAHELIMTGDPISAEKALEYGLVTRVVDDPMAEALEMAEKLKARSPDATAAIKLSNQKSWNASTATLLARETLYQVALIMSKNWRIMDSRNRKDPTKPFVKRQWWW